MQSPGATVKLGAEPASLAPEEEAAKYLALAACARLRGDRDGVSAALDTLITRQPGMLEAWIEKADLMADSGDLSGALDLVQRAIQKFRHNYPDATHPPILLLVRAEDLAGRLAAQQQASGSRKPQPAR